VSVKKGIVAAKGKSVRTLQQPPVQYSVAGEKEWYGWWKSRTPEKGGDVIVYPATKEKGPAYVKRRQ